MKTAPLAFRLHGWTYRQLKREGRVVLYSQGQTAAYEVHIVRLKKPRLFNGHLFPACEELASNEDFGHRGWTFPNLEAAEAKMATLVSLDTSNARKSLTPQKCGAFLKVA